ncbi:Cell morphogenesis protein PAG1 [Fusarium falciforme]
MSMTRSTSRAIRKEYERTQSLFGIPEASGWAIPVPAKKTDATRANIHAAFYTCQGSEGMLTETSPTPDVEFHADDFPYGYFGASERTETMLSDEGRGDVHVGDLATKLDSLDDFFDEPSSPATDDDGRSSRTITEYTPESFETGAQLYDEQILPILHEASNNTSFQNGFADRSPAMSREASSNTMNPGAFNVIVPTTRPGLHSRSITSPSAPASYQPQMGDIASDDEYVGGFSDADDERPSTGHTEGAFFLENMIKPVTRRPQSRMRRVTQSRSRDERSREKPPPQPASRLANNMFPPKIQNQGQGDML